LQEQKTREEYKETKKLGLKLRRTSDLTGRVVRKCRKTSPAGGGATQEKTSISSFMRAAVVGIKPAMAMFYGERRAQRRHL